MKIAQVWAPDVASSNALFCRARESSFESLQFQMDVCAELVASTFRFGIVCKLEFRAQVVELCLRSCKLK